MLNFLSFPVVISDLKLRYPFPRYEPKTERGPTLQTMQTLKFSRKRTKTNFAKRKVLGLIPHEPECLKKLASKSVTISRFFVDLAESTL